MIICHIRLPLQARTPPRPLLLVTWANGTRGSKRDNLITLLSASRYVSSDGVTRTCACDIDRQRHEVESTVRRYEQSHLCRQAVVVPKNWVVRANGLAELLIQLLYSVQGHIKMASSHMEGRLYYTSYSQVYLYE